MKTTLSPALQIESTLKRMYALGEDEPPEFAVFIRNHRLFLAGDVVIRTMGNGGAERFEFSGVSSRGYDVRRFYLKTAAFRRRRGSGDRVAGPIRFLSVPHEILKQHYASEFGATLANWLLVESRRYAQR